MHILIINPNSNEMSTESIKMSINDFICDEVQIDCWTNKSGPLFIASNYDYYKAAPGLVNIIETTQDIYDGYVIACHADPNLDLLKEISHKPIIGIAEASLKLATMLGHKFSIIAPGTRGIPNKEFLVAKYGVSQFLASIRTYDAEDGDTKLQQMLSAARKAVTEDFAEIIVLGCGEFAGLNDKLQKNLGVPVLDGVACATLILIGLIKCNLNISKRLRYA